MSDLAKIFWSSLLLSYACIAVMWCLMFYGISASIEMVVQLVLGIINMVPL